MKNILYRTFPFILTLLFLSTSCDEKEFSEDYDINFPISEITDFNPKTDFIDKEVTVFGKNLDLVTNLSIGTATCEILSQAEDKLVFKISRSAETGTIVMKNKYKRESSSAEVFVSQYLDMEISSWPGEIEKGRSFEIVGKNMDMIKSVKFENVTLKKISATESKAVYGTSDVTLPASGTLTVESKTGQSFTSPAINVVEPKDTYTPEASIMLFDFDTVEPIIAAGDATDPFTSGKNLGGIAPFFGNYYSIIAPKGNGWNGNYQYIETTNNGSGFDLSSYESPYITFLVNTNGKRGYFNPALTINGSTEDKHFTGQGGEYTDNYMIETTGWEWRSYNLEDMGFSNVKGQIEKISLWIRGGNVGDTEPFEIHFDQVMITDGPLNPVVVFDFETMPSLSDVTSTSGANMGTGVSLIPQGNKYLTVKDPANSASWGYKGDIFKEGNNGVKFASNETFYINFLINTGSTAGGYFQLQFLQASGANLGMHFKGSNAYGDDYMFANTGGKWQWRSYKVDPKGLEDWGGSSSELNLNEAFDMKIGFSTGNVGGAYEVNLDYFVLTSVPLDTTLK